MHYRISQCLILIATWTVWIDRCTSLAVGEPASSQADLDVGFGKPGADGMVHQVAVVTSGPEQGVYFGGEFKHICGQYIPSLARFDGVKWHQVGDGSPCTVTAILVDPDIRTPVVYVAGRSHLGGTTMVAQYRNGQWQSIAKAIVGQQERVLTMAIHPVQGEKQLVIGGSFTEIRGEGASKKPPRETGMGVAAWNGKSWSALGQGLQGRVSLNGFSGFGGTTSTGPHAVRALLSIIESGRSVLYAGGDFTSTGKQDLAGIARWDESNWRPEEGMKGSVHALCMYDDGVGNALYAAGSLYSQKDHSQIWGVWRKIDGSWQPVGDGNQPTILRLAPLSYKGTNHLLSLGLFANSGPSKFPNIEQWDGKQWSLPDWLPLDPGGFGPTGLTSVVAYQDALYLGGNFSQMGTTSTDRIARMTTSSLPQTSRNTPPTPERSAFNLTDLKYRVIKVAAEGGWSSGNLRFAGLSNTGRVVAAVPTKIPVAQETAAPLFNDNPFEKPRWGLSNDPHIMRDRILLWDIDNQDKSTILPGGDPKYAWKNVCLSPNGKHLVAIETRTLGSRSAKQWKGAKWQPVSRQTNQELVIFGVNDEGTVVGASEAAGANNGLDAVVIEAGQLKILPSPTRNAIAVAVSNSGLIVGRATDKFGTSQACLWKNGKLVLLGTLTGKWSMAHAVNDTGMVVGVSRTEKDEDAAFVWQNDQMRPVIDTSKVSSIAYGINKSGIIVGMAFGSMSYGFIATGDQVVNLNDLLINDLEWTVKRAIAVNDQNYVLAIGETESKEFLVLLAPQ